MAQSRRGRSASEMVEQPESFNVASPQSAQLGANDEIEDAAMYIPQPPDGGYGWVVVFASFMANFIVDGISYAYAVFMPEFVRHFDSTEATAALVGSLVTGCYLISGPIVSGLVNKFGARRVMMAGGLVSTVAFFVSAFSPTLPHLMITYGVCGGIGFGLIYLPAIVHVNFYFEKKRALATGIAVSGSGVGTFVFAPMAVLIIDSYGAMAGLWIVAGIIFHTLIFGALLRPLEPAVAIPDDQDPMYPLQPDQSRGTMGGAFSQNSLYSKIVNGVDQQQPGSPTQPMAIPMGKASGSVRSINNGHAATAPAHVPFPPDHAGDDLQRVARVRAAKLSESSGPAPSSFRQPRGSRDPEDYSGPPPVSQRPSVVGSRPHLGRSMSKMSRMSVKSYRDSMMRLSTSAYSTSYGNLNPSNSIRAKDFSRPMYRSDIFFSGSVHNLPEYKKSRSNLNAYRASTISIPQPMAFDPQSQMFLPVEDSSRFCWCLPRQVRDIMSEMMDFRLLKHPVMLMLCLSNVLGMMAFYVPFVYLTNHAIYHGIDRSKASFLLSIIGITNTLGRLFFGWMADRQWVTSLFINNICLLICGVITLFVPLLKSYPPLAAYAIVFGFFVSAYISLTSEILVLYFGLEKLSNSFGLIILFRGLTALVGSPIAGAIYDATGTYDASFYFAGILILGAAAISAFIPIYSKVWSRLTGKKPFEERGDDDEMEYEDGEEYESGQNTGRSAGGEGVIEMVSLNDAAGTADGASPQKQVV